MCRLPRVMNTHLLGTRQVYAMENKKKTIYCTGKFCLPVCSIVFLSVPLPPRFCIPTVSIQIGWNSLPEVRWQQDLSVLLLNTMFPPPSRRYASMLVLLSSLSLFLAEPCTLYTSLRTLFILYCHFYNETGNKIEWACRFVCLSVNRFFPRHQV